MVWENSWQGPFGEYVGYFDCLIGDRRSAVTFREIVRGIIAAGSAICQRIAAQSAVLMRAKDGAQRVIRFVRQESTKRSQVDAEALVARLRERGLAQLSGAESGEVWLILDLCDLRKPYARRMEALMKVRDLQGDLVPGYRTVNVLAVTPGRRGVLYHRLFSSTAEEFVSEPAEVQRALSTTSAALAGLKERLVVSWIVDRGLDDVAVWRSIWEQGEHVVCRVQHTERRGAYPDGAGGWQVGNIEQDRGSLERMATARTRLEVRVGAQRRPKRQEVTVELRAGPVRLSYESNVRREGCGEMVEKTLWLVEARLVKTDLAPWLLLTDWPVTDAASALRIFQMYRQRWAVEDSFKFTKECVGWEQVQLLDLEAVRTMVALAWVAAGFLYELGVTLEWPEVELLARLGGWAARADCRPGKTVIARGLQRLFALSTAQAFLDAYRAEHGALPPRIAALLGQPPPTHQL